jgi:hypothetical protein
MHGRDRGSDIEALRPTETPREVVGPSAPRRLRSDRYVPDASPIVGEEYQDEQEAVRRGRDDEEIGGHDLADVILQEGAPAL